MDSLARKVAQQIIEKFYAKDLDRGYGQNPLRMTLTEGEMAEIIESALAPMREALQEGIDMVRVLQGGRIAGGWADRAERLLKGEQ